MASYKKSTEMRNSIIEAATHLIEEKGYSDLNIKDISEYLNIPRSLMYYYFKNKDDLLMSMVMSSFSAIDERLKEMPFSTMDIMVKLTVKYILFFRHIAFNPIYTEFLINMTGYPAYGKTQSDKWIANYYEESEELFRAKGLSQDSKEFRIHVLMVEVVWKAIVTGVYYGTIDLNERETMEFYMERTMGVTFNMNKEEISNLLDEAFEAAEKYETIV